MWSNIQYNLAKLFNFPIKPESDRRVQNLLAEIKRQGNFYFKIELHKGGWTAECENVKGIITGGTNPQPTQSEVDEKIKDAIFSAFGIPPYLCRDNLVYPVWRPAKELVYAGGR
ncbi:hypothetical protein A2W54_01865 [Candidatus Giovannonibacteria bacterium RIFCSPHIGHO2_02_43_13]|uniref:Uncharacterized protein n=1 Tax=Candidatus Giovannonibacteria bacterium RIFCSPHIGHO2_02_43_13 TaxID=1798330 RepID=A0A1F5WQP5_9BACT|nr:MAG: hypothetical protein UW28_C0035G0002 [Parcubacteria group bacterium GW2011_GWA2_44_13]OGF73883.1 MAG: hypothetical protein A3E06_03320 [Candidatus Giovannonibacteria bacterium RIFCSPHIGHO2_12_FULL_44_42]OGF77571.1 MAG: hypothetical protein A2W54_01865 [Candidatus Giovannonibacteria bacterium RIFCSPHIGHO2_02_43_13]OGF89211.1 MAG: hypothetical protein A3I94_01315 [Candidatus Giovannonibacteria bacterium RIFCSPLOWO2_02_FULL_43_54]